MVVAVVDDITERSELSIERWDILTQLVREIKRKYSGIWLMSLRSDSIKSVVIFALLCSSSSSNNQDKAGKYRMMIMTMRSKWIG